MNSINYCNYRWPVGRCAALFKLGGEKVAPAYIELIVRNGRISPFGTANQVGFEHFDLPVGNLRITSERAKRADFGPGRNCWIIPEFSPEDEILITWLINSYSSGTTFTNLELLPIHLHYPRKPPSRPVSQWESAKARRDIQCDVYSNTCFLDGELRPKKRPSNRSRDIQF